MLKIDLLPKRFAVARRNLRLVVLVAVLLVASGAIWLFRATAINAEKMEYQRKTAELQPTLHEIATLTAETQAKQGELAPIKAKVDFAKAADNTGPAFWRAFHAVNQYVWSEGQVSSFAITPPGSVSFTVQVRGTMGAARFLLNLLRCPALTNINMNGPGAGWAWAEPRAAAGRPPCRQRRVRPGAWACPAR